MTISLSQFARDIDLAKATVYRKCQELGINSSNGLSPEDCDRLRQELSITPALKPVAIESGNHQVILTQPELPTAFSLEPLRTSEAIAFEDPLAIANQFLQVADQLIDGMQHDIMTREQRNRQTQQAKEAIASKTSELKLEQRIYRERASMLDATQTADTQALQTALQQLQQLGKPLDTTPGG